MNDTPTPDYGEPWSYNYDLDLALTRNGSAVYERRIIACVNACAGMVDPAAEITALRRDLGQARGERDRQKVKIAAMHEAIREAHDAIKASPYLDQQALAKLQPFIIP